MKHKLTWNGRSLTVALIQKHPFEVRVTEGENECVVEIAEDPSRTSGRVNLGNGFCSYWVTETQSAFWVTLDGRTFAFEKDHGRPAHADDPDNDFTAPMPGKIVLVAIQEGAQVAKGDVLVIMEAMKMEHRIEAPSDGTVVTLRCAAGELVEQGYALLDFEAK